MRVDAIPALITDTAWQTYSCGRGSKGHRDYSWAWIDLLPEPGDPHGADQVGRHHLLIRRNSATGELAYLRCYTPRPTPLATLVRVAGQRWRIEESFQAAKGTQTLHGSSLGSGRPSGCALDAHPERFYATIPCGLRMYFLAAPLSKSA